MTGGRYSLSNTSYWPLITLAALLPLIACILILLLLINRQIYQEMEAGLRGAALDAAVAVERAVADQISLLDALAAAPALDNGDFAVFREQAARIAEKQPHWLNVIITDQRNQLFNLRLGSGTSLPPLRDPTSAALTWTSGRRQIGNLVEGAIGLRVPVIRNDRVVYTLAVALSPAMLTAILRSQQVADRWIVAAVDENRIIIGRSREADQFVGTPANQSFLDLLSVGGRRAVRTITREGIDAYGIALPIAGTPWRISVGAPLEALDAPYRLVRYLLYGAAAFSIAVAVLIALAGMLRAITLTRDARAMHGRMQRAETASVERSTLLANMRTDLNAPLQSIIDLANAMSEQRHGALGHPKYIEYAIRIKQSGENLLGLTEDLLELSRMEIGRLEVRFERIELLPLLQDVWVQMVPLAEQQECKLALRVSPGLYLRADRRLLQKALSHVMRNAIRLTPQGNVNVEAYVAGNELCLVVADDGVALPLRDLALAMGSDNEHAPHAGGIGQIHSSAALALPLARRITELLGGKFEIESRAGAGTTVTLRLPLSPLPE